VDQAQRLIGRVLVHGCDRGHRISYVTNLPERQDIFIANGETEFSLRHILPGNDNAHSR
jgi:hypothetical protein